MAPRVIAIAAMDEGRAIGLGGKIPWHLPEDMKRFSTLTTGQSVLMGRKTYDSLPERFRPLPNRKNIVVTRSPEEFCGGKDVEVITSPTQFVEQVKAGSGTSQDGTLWIIGGADIYRLTLPYWDELYLTVLHSRYQGDAFFPEFEDSFDLVDRQDREGYSFLQYRRKLQ